MKAGSKDFNLGPTYGSNPYLDFNTVSPNNSGALGKVAVRQAICLRDRPGAPDPGPRRPAGQPAADAHPADRHQRRAVRAEATTRSLQPGQGQVDAEGRGLPQRPDPDCALQRRVDRRAEDVPDAAGRHGARRHSPEGPRGAVRRPVRQVPVPCRARPRTAPGTSACPAGARTGTATPPLSFFNPIYSVRRRSRRSGSNFSEYNNPTVNALISQALQAANAAAAARIWAQIDKMVTIGRDRPTRSPRTCSPTTTPASCTTLCTCRRSQNFDPTNVWLSTPGC